MLKRSLSLFALIAVLIPSAGAGPMGPVRPSVGRFGLQVDVSADSHKTRWSQNAADRRKADSLMVFGQGSFGLTDKVEIYGRLGGANLKIKDSSDIGPNGPFSAIGATIKGTNKLAWGIGIGAVLYDAGTWDFSGTANYLGHNSHDGKEPDGNSEIDYWECNIGAQVQAKYDQFYPYLGVKYSDNAVDYVRVRGNSVTYKDRTHEHIGLYVGTGVDFSPQWSCYVEGRFIDETSGSAGIRFTF